MSYFSDAALNIKSEFFGYGSKSIQVGVLRDPKDHIAHILRSVIMFGEAVPQLRADEQDTFKRLLKTLEVEETTDEEAIKIVQKDFDLFNIAIFLYFTRFNYLNISKGTHSFVPPQCFTPVSQKFFCNLEEIEERNEQGEPTKEVGFFVEPNEMPSAPSYPDGTKIELDPKFYLKHSLHGDILESKLLHPGIDQLYTSSDGYDSTLTGERKDLFEYLPKNTTGAMLGVDEGNDVFEMVLPIVQPKKLHLVDPWSLLPEEGKLTATFPSNTDYQVRVPTDYILLDGRRKNVTDHYKAFGCKDKKVVQDKIPPEFKDKISLKEGFSQLVAEDFKDSSLDWVFTDWDGEYTDKLNELLKWLPKVKQGGYITGEVFDFWGQHTPTNFAATMDFMLLCVAARPDLLKKHIHKKTHFINKYYEEVGAVFARTNDCNLTFLEICTPNYAFGDVVVFYAYDDLKINKSFHNSHYFQFKPDQETLSALSSTGCITLFPNQRANGGGFCIQVGDWVNKNKNFINKVHELVNMPNMDKYHGKKLFKQ